MTLAPVTVIFFEQQSVTHSVRWSWSESSKQGPNPFFSREAAWAEPANPKTAGGTIVALWQSRQSLSSVASSALSLMTERGRSPCRVVYRAAQFRTGEEPEPVGWEPCQRRPYAVHNSLRHQVILIRLCRFFTPQLHCNTEPLVVRLFLSQ